MLASLIMSSNVVQAQEKTDETEERRNGQEGTGEMMHNQYDNMRRLREEQIQTRRILGSRIRRLLKRYASMGVIRLLPSIPTIF